MEKVTPKSESTSHDKEAKEEMKLMGAEKHSDSLIPGWKDLEIQSFLQEWRYNELELHLQEKNRYDKLSRAIRDGLRNKGIKKSCGQCLDLLRYLEDLYWAAYAAKQTPGKEPLLCPYEDVLHKILQYKLFVTPSLPPLNSLPLPQAHLPIQGWPFPGTQEQNLWNPRPIMYTQYPQAVGWQPNTRSPPAVWSVCLPEYPTYTVTSGVPSVPFDTPLSNIPPPQLQLQGQLSRTAAPVTYVQYPQSLGWQPSNLSNTGEYSACPPGNPTHPVRSEEPSVSYHLPLNSNPPQQVQLQEDLSSDPGPVTYVQESQAVGCQPCDLNPPEVCSERPPETLTPPVRSEDPSDSSHPPLNCLPPQVQLQDKPCPKPGPDTYVQDPPTLGYQPCTINPPEECSEHRPENPSHLVKSLEPSDSLMQGWSDQEVQSFLQEWESIESKPDSEMKKRNARLSKAIRDGLRNKGIQRSYRQCADMLKYLEGLYWTTYAAKQIPGKEHVSCPYEGALRRILH